MVDLRGDLLSGTVREDKQVIAYAACDPRMPLPKGRVSVSLDLLEPWATRSASQRQIANSVSSGQTLKRGRVAAKS